MFNEIFPVCSRQTRDGCNYPRNVSNVEMATSESGNLCFVVALLSGSFFPESFYLKLSSWQENSIDVK